MRCSALCVFLGSLLWATVACRDFGSHVIVSPSDSLRSNPLENIEVKGDITGFVTLRDEFGSLKPNNSGMIVSLEGEKTAFPATTRPEGRFVIANVFAGKYNLSYNKKGYGNYKRIGINHVGGNVPTIAEPVDLWETSQTTASALSVAVNGLNLTFSGSTAPVQPVSADSTQQRRVRLFLGHDETVSQFRYVSSLKPLRVPPGGTGAFVLKLSADDLLAFKPGERVYVVAYGTNAVENAYVDPDTKRTVYAGLNPTPSNVVSFVLP